MLPFWYNTMSLFVCVYVTVSFRWHWKIRKSSGDMYTYTKHEMNWVAANPDQRDQSITICLTPSPIYTTIRTAVPMLTQCIGIFITTLFHYLSHCTSQTKEPKYNMKRRNQKRDVQFCCTMPLSINTVPNSLYL